MMKKAWMAASAAMTEIGHGQQGAKVFCGAFFQKSDRFSFTEILCP